MKDNELRTAVLEYFYKARSHHPPVIPLNTEAFAEIAPPEDIFRICDQLAEYRLIDWHPQRVTRRGYSATVEGKGRITARGVDALETNGQESPIVLKIPMTQNINISGSEGIQIGDHNVQNISIALERLVSEIDSSSSTDEQKSEAKSKLGELLRNPTVAAVLGNTVNGVFSLLQNS